MGTGAPFLRACFDHPQRQAARADCKGAIKHVLDLAWAQPAQLVEDMSKGVLRHGRGLGHAALLANGSSNLGPIASGERAQHRFTT